MTQHTPGPWMEYAESDDYWIAQVGEEGMPGQTICDSTELSASDTDLICAAPELLAACEAAFDWLSRFGEHAPIVFGGEAELSEQLRAAIAKAKGAA